VVQALERVPDILLPYIDCWAVQEPQAHDLDIVRGMQAQMDAGTAWLMELNDTYVFLPRHTPWVACGAANKAIGSVNAYGNNGINSTTRMFGGRPLLGSRSRRLRPETAG